MNSVNNIRQCQYDFACNNVLDNTQLICDSCIQKEKDLMESTNNLKNQMLRIDCVKNVMMFNYITLMKWVKKRMVHRQIYVKNIWNKLDKLYK